MKLYEAVSSVLIIYFMMCFMTLIVTAGVSSFDQKVENRQARQCIRKDDCKTNNVGVPHEDSCYGSCALCSDVRV